MRLTRRYRFAASHRLHSEALSQDRNREVYGKCNNPFGHGHNYVLEVSVRGSVDEGTGRVVSVDDLDRLVEEQVLVPLDHADLNGQMVAVPTTENLAVEIRRRLSQNWSGTLPQLEKIRLHETKRNIIELNGNERNSD